MFANEAALFFGDMETLFDFKAFDASPSDKLIVQLENITDHAPINSYTVLLYSPFVLFVSIFFVLFISYLVQSVVSLRRFFETLNTTDYTMLSAQSDLSHIKFILGNRYEGILEAEVFLLDESLKSVNTIVKAKYINFINDNGVYRFRLLASTFIREGQLFGYLLLMDASATQDRINEYELIYRTDSLTQLPNRTELDDFIKKTANSSAKYLMSIVDLDHFKSINDNFGHHFGDLVLQHSANHLKKSVKLNEDDRLIRMGGEEFIILLSLEAQVFDDACKSIAKRILNFNDEKISFSGGILLWEPDKKTFDSAYKQCDKLLYEAKEGGRRQIRMLDYAGNKVVINEVSTRVDVINFQDQKSKVR